MADQAQPRELRDALVAALDERAAANSYDRRQPKIRAPTGEIAAARRNPTTTTLRSLGAAWA